MKRQHEVPEIKITRTPPPLDQTQPVMPAPIAPKPKPRPMDPVNMARLLEKAWFLWRNFSISPFDAIDRAGLHFKATEGVIADAKLRFMSARDEYPNKDSGWSLKQASKAAAEE